MKSNFFVVCFLLLSNLALTQIPNYVPTNGLVGWWPFNGNANDESGSGNDGIVNGPTLTEDRFGNPNKAYLFQSTEFDEISVDNSENLSITENISILCWYKNYTSNYVAALLGMGGPYESGGYNLLSSSTNNFGTTDYASPSFGRQNFLNSQINATTYNININLNEWTFICCTYDGFYMKIYINGHIMDSTECNFNLPDLTEPLLFGKERNYSPNQRYFDGVIDEIGIWNRALTKDEIFKLYDSNGQTVLSSDFQTTESNLDIYPNPTTDVVNIDFHDLNKFEGGKVKIMSMSGQIVYEENITQSKMTLSVVDRFSKGIYIVTTTDSGGNILSNEKLIVQ